MSAPEAAEPDDEDEGADDAEGLEGDGQALAEGDDTGAESDDTGAEGDDAGLMTPLPGFGYDPIFGSGGVGALEGRSQPPPVLAGPPPGEVLLHLPGRRRGGGALLFVVLGVAQFLIFGCLALDVIQDTVLPWPEAACARYTWLLWFLGAVLAGTGVILRILEQGVEITLTTEGAAVGAGRTEGWLAWEQVRGYRASAGEPLLLEHVDGEYALLLPARDEASRSALLGVLRERGVRRLDEVGEPGSPGA